MQPCNHAHGQNFLWLIESNLLRFIEIVWGILVHARAIYPLYTYTSKRHCQSTMRDSACHYVCVRIQHPMYWLSTKYNYGANESRGCCLPGLYLVAAVIIVQALNVCRHHQSFTAKLHHIEALILHCLAPPPSLVHQTVSFTHVGRPTTRPKCILYFWSQKRLAG